MKSKMIIPVLLLIFVPFSICLAEETTIQGEASVTGVYVGVKGGEGGEARFTKYQDLEENFRLFGNVDLGLDSDRHFLRFQANDIAYDTQRYILGGGMWGKFGLEFFYDEIPNNYTFDARTYFQGAGSHNLTGVPNTNFNTWNTFDYSIERKRYGGGFNLPLLKPFFFDVSFQREERDGIKAAGVAVTSPGGASLELPEPIDYTTNNLRLEGGYAKNPLFLSLGLIYSDFNDSNDKLNFTHPRSPFNLDTLTLPPDNNSYKGFFKGAVKLPMNSKFNVNLGYGVAKSDTTLLSTFITEGASGAVSPGILSQPDFDGKIKRQDYAFVLTSSPFRFLDGKLFYRFYKTDNENDVVTQTFEGDTEVNHPFDYKKHSAGIDFGWRLPARFLLNTRYQFINTDRKEEGAPEQTLPENKDNIYSVDLRWNGLDFLVPKIGYEKLIRSADFEGSTSINRKWAYAGQSRDTYRVGVDVFPVDPLSFGLGYSHKKIDYNEIHGLLNEERDAFDISVDYSFRQLAKLYTYGDYERTEYEQFQRRVSPTPPLGDWSAKEKDRSWGYGVGTEIYAIPEKLTLYFQHDYVKSNGSVDFTIDPVLFISALGLAGANNETVDIFNWDDYTKYSFKFKAAYNLSKSLIASAGYVYERFKYSDAQLDDYLFTFTQGANTSYFTGYLKDQTYTASLIFAGLTYRF